MMEVVRYSDSMRDEWDELVATSSNGTFLQTRNFLDLQTSRFREDSFVGLVAGGGSRRIQALMPGVTIGAQYVSHPGATHGGVIFRHALGLTDSVRVIGQFAERLRQDAHETWKVTPVPVFLRSVPWEGDLYGYWRLRCHLVARGGSSFLPADASLGRRKNRGVASRAGVVCRESLLPDVAFSLIREVVADRHRVEATHTDDEFRNLLAANQDDVRVVEAVHEGEIVAASVLFRMPSALHFQYMGSGDRGRKVQALDAIVQYVWENVRDPREGLSFGVSTTEFGHTLNGGLASFKEGFGALARPVDAYLINLQ